jgi:glycosyltransferase involved in cell wall biosynthesis
MRVLLLTRYGALGASSRVRFYQFVPGLEARGCIIESAPLLSDDYLADLYAGRATRVAPIAMAYLRRVSNVLRAARQADVIWLEKEALPWIPATLERLVLRTSLPVVVDYDDAVFHRYDLHRLGVVRATLGSKIDVVMRRAAIVVAGNEYLASRARQAGARRVEIVPTVVDTTRYLQTPEPAEPPFTVGWIGSPATAPYLVRVREPLKALQSTHGAKLCLIGAPPGTLRELAPDIVPWREDKEVAALQACHVGMMPLPDEPWERGKCGYKLIQFMACGRAVIGSPVGVNREVICHGTNGWLADSTAEWREAFATLAGDPERRHLLAEAGRQTVEERYSMTRVLPVLDSLLRDAAQSVRRLPPPALPAS